MANQTGFNHTRTNDNREFAIGLARAFAGAIIFGLPLFMTMEMWWLGFYIERWQLVLLVLFNFPLLVGMAHYSGFEQSVGLKDDILSAFVAYGVGLVSATIILFMLAIIKTDMPLNEIIGKITLQAIPGSIGALLARTQLGEEEDEEKQEKRSNYFGELFIMMVGTVFVGLNLAPTEEIVLIAHRLSPLSAIALMVVSLLLMHAFVYSIEFHGTETAAEGVPLWQVFLRFTVVGYAIALSMSFFVLWLFDRTEGTSLSSVVIMVVVLGFPNAIGAAAARLIL